MHSPGGDNTSATDPSLEPQCWEMDLWPHGAQKTLAVTVVLCIGKYLGGFRMIPYNLQGALRLSFMVFEARVLNNIQYDRLSYTSNSYSMILELLRPPQLTHERRYLVDCRVPADGRFCGTPLFSWSILRLRSVYPQASNGHPMQYRRNTWDTGPSSSWIDLIKHIEPLLFVFRLLSKGAGSI